MADVQGATDFLRFLVCSLVDDSSSVQIETQSGDRHTTLELSLSPGDHSTLTANEGELAELLHVALDAYSYKHRIRTQLQIMDALGDSDSGDGPQADLAP